MERMRSLCVLWGWLCGPRVAARHGIHTATPTRHTGSTQPPPQDTRGPHSQPLKTHGVHTASPIRHTGSTQPAPQDTQGPHSLQNTAPMQVKLTFSEKYRFFDFQNRRFTCIGAHFSWFSICLLYTSPSPRDRQKSRMPSSA